MATLNLDFPGHCTLAHSQPVPIATPAELLSHHISAHGSLPLASVTNAFTPLSSPTANPASVPSTDDPLASLGILRSRVRAKAASSAGAGANFNLDEIKAFVAHLGLLLGPDSNFDVSDFYVELLIYFSNHLGTNKTENTGALILRDTNDDNKEVMISWHDVTLKAKKFFANSGREFTWRKTFTALAPALRVLRDDGLPALASLTTRGSRVSRKWRLPDGNLAPYWIFIPDLFPEDITPLHRTALEPYLLSRAALTTSSHATYTGLDQDGFVQKATGDVAALASSHAALADALARQKQSASASPFS